MELLVDLLYNYYGVTERLLRRLELLYRFCEGILYETFAQISYIFHPVADRGIPPIFSQEHTVPAFWIRPGYKHQMVSCHVGCKRSGPVSDWIRTIPERDQPASEHPAFPTTLLHVTILCVWR